MNTRTFFKTIAGAAIALFGARVAKAIPLEKNNPWEMPSDVNIVTMEVSTGDETFQYFALCGQDFSREFLNKEGFAWFLQVARPTKQGRVVVRFKCGKKISTIGIVQPYEKRREVVNVAIRRGLQELFYVG